MSEVVPNEIGQFKKNLIVILIGFLGRLDQRLEILNEIVLKILENQPLPENPDGTIAARLKAATQGVQGDPLVIEAQSYLYVMGFPVGNFGPNRNGIDGKLGELTAAAVCAFNRLRQNWVDNGLNDSTMAELELLTYEGACIRELAKAAHQKGVRFEIGNAAGKADFVMAVYFYAILDEVTSKVPAALTTAQAILESGYGKYVATDRVTGKYSYNLFGIKGTGPAGSVNSWTREENPQTGIWEPVLARFKAFDTFADSIKGHSQFFYDNIKRYSAAFNTNNPADFARTIAKAGYATDSQYANKLISLMEYWGLK